MASESLILYDASALDDVQAVVSGLGLGEHIEVRVEPAHDYDGQELAIDVDTPTPAELDDTVRTLQQALAPRRVEVSSVIDDETMARLARTTAR